jgi:hypothetical protein
MQLRRFPAKIDALAKDWIKQSVSNDKWIEKGPYGNSDSQPFKVEKPNLEGLAKPGVKKAWRRSHITALAWCRYEASGRGRTEAKRGVGVSEAWF